MGRLFLPVKNGHASSEQKIKDIREDPQFILQTQEEIYVSEPNYAYIIELDNFASFPRAVSQNAAGVFMYKCKKQIGGYGYNHEPQYDYSVYTFYVGHDGSIIPYAGSLQNDDYLHADDIFYTPLAKQIISAIEMKSDLFGHNTKYIGEKCIFRLNTPFDMNFLYQFAPPGFFIPGHHIERAVYELRVDSKGQIQYLMAIEFSNGIIRTLPLALEMLGDFKFKAFHSDRIEEIISSYEASADNPAIWQLR